MSDEPFKNPDAATGRPAPQFTPHANAEWRDQRVEVLAQFWDEESRRWTYRIQTLLANQVYNNVPESELIRASR